MKNKRRYDDFLCKIIKTLPTRLISLCAIQVIAEATSGKYGNTIVSELVAMDAVNRYSRIYGHGGCGKDEHYDSNR